MARISWTDGAVDVCRVVRAYDPKPGAWTTQRGTDVKLFGARRTDTDVGAPGVVREITEDGMLVACGDGAVRIAWVHPAGKKRLRASEWAAGRGVAAGDVLGH